VKQVIVIRPDRAARIAASDLISGLVGLLIRQLGGINPMICYKHALKAVQNQ
jgi:hypothetical protein